MKEPLVSVIVPTKNSEHTLSACLKSIKRQTYRSLEVIVVDNFSDDQTVPIATGLADIVLQKGPERSAQRNYAVAHSRGTFVLIVDSDMELDPSVVSECVERVTSSKDVQAVIIPEESFGIGFWSQCKRLERGFYVGIPYMEAARFFYRTDYVRAGGYDEAMVSGEDWDLSQRIATDDKLGRVASLIHHNEGRISLLRTVQKKYYYAKKFHAYLSTNKNTDASAKQTNIVGRYALYFSQPRKLFRNPILGVGMLFMKTCEFGFGAIGLIAAKFSRQ